jgi:hypothetical protein
VYGKIFSSMYDGSLYGNWKAIVTFQQMIVLCNEDGVVDMTPQALAARTSIPLDIIREGLELLEAPDQYSRTRDHGGRRIERIDAERPWGWRIVNYRKYRTLMTAEQKREADRVRLAVKRAAMKSTTVDADRQVATKSDTARHDATQSDKKRQSQMSLFVANVAQAEAEAEAVKSRGAHNSEKRGSRLHVQSLPDAWREFCRAERPDLCPEKTFSKFSDYWTAQPGRKGVKVDWLATWRNWVREERAPPPDRRSDNGDSPAYREYLASLKGPNVL